MSIDLINNLTKMFFINIFTCLVYIKISNCKALYNMKFIIGNGILLSILYVVLEKLFQPMSSIIIMLTLNSFMIACVLKEKINYAILVTSISFLITYVSYWLSVIISAMLISFVQPNINSNNTIILVGTLLLTGTILYMFSKMKRIKNGINFIKNARINMKIVNNIIFLTGNIVLIFGMLQKQNDKVLNTYLLYVALLLFVILFLWIKSQITKTYKSKMRDRTIEIQKTEIDEKNKILEEIKEENLNFATTIHKYNKKISALEYIIKNRLEQETNTEFANELAIILKETKETAENFAKETEIKTNKIPETKVPGIDTMLKYMQEEARKKNINFEVKLNTNINSLLENTISKDKFETLIGDHLKDAIIAVDASKNTYKSILVTMGLVEGIYEFSVYDTGIEFEIETLLKLGEEQITTHKETGGSGIGFMTTFETLKECKASLIIEEYNPETTSYTKCITIKFDGKNKYKIYSYRANKIKEQKYKRKITIEELK